MKLQEIKNLNLINLNELFCLALKESSVYCIENEIISVKDYETLYKHYFYYNLLILYSQKTRQNILLYFEEKDYGKHQKLIKRSLKLLKDKIKFPTIISNISFETYFNLISDDSPEYDEVINNNFSLIDHFKDLKSYIKKSGLLYLNKKYSNLPEQIGLLLLDKNRI